MSTSSSPSSTLRRRGVFARAARALPLRALPPLPLLLLTLVLLGLLGTLAGCRVGQAGGTSGSAGPLHHLTLGLTYIPDVQFAPFYVAQSLGYYREAGLDVTLRHHGFTEGEFDALVAGHEDAIFAGGDETLQARSHGIPITYVGEV